MIRPLLDRPADEPVALGGDGDRTAADLRAASGRVARWLAGRGAGDVLLVADDRWHFAAALLGTWRAGRAAVLPANAQPETLRALVVGGGLAAFLHDRPGAPEGTDVRPVLAAGDADAPAPAVGEATRLVTLMTSGSTGAPRAWPKTAAQLLGEAAGLAEAFRVAPGARILATVPPHHIYGLLFSVLLPLRARGAFARETPLHAEAVAAAAARLSATHLVSAPAHLHALAAEPGAALRVARVFSSGAPLPAATSRAIAARTGAPVTEVYGSTETGGIAWRDDPDAPWRPFPRVKVLAGEDGTLLLDSPLLPAGEPRPWRGADRIALADGGAFSLLGRTDGVVKVGGKRVALAELEARALAVPGVRDAAALAEEVGGARGHEVWLAAVAPGLDPATLRAALGRWLDPTVLPRRIRLVEALPREPSGKITRERLRPLFAAPARVTELVADAESARAGAGGAEVRVLGVTVPPDLHYFRGHFDVRPVLPGVVQLRTLVMRQVARAWPELTRLRRVSRLKFKRIIPPGTRLTLTLSRRAGEPRVGFEIESPSGSCASGALEFAGGEA
jgi:4-coumarate--CoA ligase (photoactive yellow protein activation family)